MKKSYFIVTGIAGVLIVILSLGTPATSAQFRNEPGRIGTGNPHVQKISGVMMTNFRAIDENTTLGIATGDLRGALAARLLKFDPAKGEAEVLHFMVTENGDTITFAPAKAIFAPGAGGDPSFAHVVYKEILITGGTGRFAGAKGVMKSHGSTDFNNAEGGQAAFRYSGEILFPN